MSRITPLHHKIAQMLIVGFDGPFLDAEHPIVSTIRDYGLGGVILFDINLRDKTAPKNILNPAQVKQLTHQLHAYAATAHYTCNLPRLPLWIAIDYEGGKVNRLKPQYGFPETLSAADFARLNDEEAIQVAQTMATTLVNYGINVNFTPLVDLNTNPHNPIIGQMNRSYGKDASTVIKYAAHIAAAHQQHNIMFSYKHFPGHGSSVTDSHLGITDVTPYWSEQELQPYIASINSDNPCPAIMVGHIINKHLDDSGLPAPLSYKMMTTLLRHTLHYKGLLIADDLQMQAITQCFGQLEAITTAINAGIDLLIFGNQLTEPQQADALIELIYQQVMNGKIAEDRIDEAYQRIVVTKNVQRNHDGNKL